MIEFFTETAISLTETVEQSLPASEQVVANINSIAISVLTSGVMMLLHGAMNSLTGQVFAFSPPDLVPHPNLPEPNYPPPGTPSDPWDYV